MNSVQVVCIDARLTVPSRTPSVRTMPITRSVRSMTSVRAAVVTVNVSARTVNAPERDVTRSTGRSRTVATDRLGMPQLSGGQVLYCNIWRRRRGQILDFSVGAWNDGQTRRRR